MTFEAFVDAVDATLRADAGSDYGLFRGPHVAYWQFAGVSARLREGRRNDVELTVAAAHAEAPLVLPCAAAHVAEVARAIEAAFSSRA